MLKILQPRLQQYVKWELPNVQAVLRKCRGTRGQIVKICWIIKKAREFWKNIYFCFIYYTKPLTVWITANCGKFFKRWETRPPDCLLRNLNTDQEATVRIRYGKMDWFQIGGEVHQGYILSPCLFNLYAENIMWNVRMNEAQAGIKIARRNINILRYADDTTLMAKGEEELKSLLMKVKEESKKPGLKSTIKKWRS